MYEWNIEKIGISVGHPPLSGVTPFIFHHLCTLLCNISAAPLKT